MQPARLLALALSLTLCLVAGAAEPQPLLAMVAPAKVEPAGYWVSEKLDGVRALWDGRVLRFRSGHEVHAPAWFLRGLPPEALDGELWIGRGRFDETSGIVRRQVADEAAWRQIRYMVFELPGAAGDFSARVARMRAIVDAAGVPWLAAVEQRRVADRTELEAWLRRVIAGGGEGLMLHRADAPVLAGRNDALLKLKPWRDDEAFVIGHLPGQGRHRGRLGALLVEDRQGRRFRLGTGFSDAQRRHPPPIGSEVSYRYRSLTPSGLPRFPVFWRIREREGVQSIPGNSGVGASSTSR